MSSLDRPPLSSSSPSDDLFTEDIWRSGRAYRGALTGEIRRADAAERRAEAAEAELAKRAENPHPTRVRELEQLEHLEWRVVELERRTIQLELRVIQLEDREP